jgi:excisionase family DNA binding protein
MPQKVMQPPPPSSPDRLLRATEAAAMLGASKSTVWRFARMGKLHAVKVSERITGFRLSEIQALVAGVEQ